MVYKSKSLLLLDLLIARQLKSKVSIYRSLGSLKWRPLDLSISLWNISLYCLIELSSKPVDNSYFRDNRLISHHRSHGNMLLAPRCRLILIRPQTSDYSTIAHHIIRQVSWVQNDVSQFDLYLLLVYLEDSTYYISTQGL